MLKNQMIDLARATGLYLPARSIWRRLKAEGLVPWSPLVPSEPFLECMNYYLERLQSKGSSLGDYVEFGVSRGTSIACAFKAIVQKKASSMKLFGFDSFEGLAPKAADEGWNPGAFASTIGATERYLVRSGVDMDRVTLIKGWFDDTLTPETRTTYGMQKASVIMVDCDTYDASKKAIEFSVPMIEKEAVIIFDDWGSASEMNTIGQKEAFDEMLEQNPDLSAEPLPVYSAASRAFLLTRHA